MAAEPEVFALVFVAAELWLLTLRFLLLAAEPEVVFLVLAAEPEVVSVVAEPEVFALVFAAVEPSPEVLALAAEPEVVSVVAEPEVFALVFAAAELSPEVLVLAAEPEVVSVVAEPEVFALVFAAAELSPEVLALAAEPEVVSVADVAEPQASVDIAVAFVVLVPVSVVVVEVDSSGRPRFLAFPNVDHFASSSSSVEVVGKESVHSSTGARTNYGLCSILSNPGLHQNKNLEHCYNNPSPGYNNVSDTNDLPIDATTNHSRKTCLHLYQEQRRHRRIRHHYHIRRCRKYDGWWQRNIDVNIYRCHRWNRNGNYQRQKHCSKKQLFHFVASLLLKFGPLSYYV